MQADQRIFRVASLRSAVLLILAGSLLCGCSVLFGNSGYTLLGTVQKGSASPAKFRAKLTMATRAIELRGLDSSGKGQRLQVSVVNLGRSGFEVQNAEGRHVPAEPGVPINLYNGDTNLTTNVISLHVTGIQHSTLCEFRLETSDTNFQDEIKIYRYYASASF